ncbi:hypothetical protein [Rugamonas sp.]|uniref:hypothetical protein n=1 Tax=Rugamonas sp. TaxID=1926287 RepID=UPI0025F8BA00|nr:hypothetical protein [Rugamonas sp.]
MKNSIVTSLTLISTLAALAALSGCGSAQDLNQANMSKAMQTYLAQRGELCLAKSNWPIDVAAAETGTGSRNGVQMPVLEKLGLVSAGDAVAERKDDDGNVTKVPVRRYQLTAEGKKYYLARPPHKHEVDNRYAAAPYDFCAAKITLDKVVGWEKVAPQPTGAQGPAEAVVTYTYQVQPAPWSVDANVGRVFPMLANVLKGAGVMQLKESFVLTPTGWEAKDL